MAPRGTTGSSTEVIVGAREKNEGAVGSRAALREIKNGDSLNSFPFSTGTTLKKAHAIQGRVINVDSVVVPGTVLQVCQLMGLKLAFFFFLLQQTVILWLCM